MILTLSTIVRENNSIEVLRKTIPIILVAVLKLHSKGKAYNYKVTKDIRWLKSLRFLSINFKTIRFQV